jgi:hypothetical protein
MDTSGQNYPELVTLETHVRLPRTSSQPFQLSGVDCGNELVSERTERLLLLLRERRKEIAGIVKSVSRRCSPGTLDRPLASFNGTAEPYSMVCSLVRVLAGLRKG